MFYSISTKRKMLRSQDGGGIGRGDHFLFYKFIERTERWTKFTKLLIASSGHQAPRKAAHCLRREVGQKYYRFKKGHKRTRDGDPSREGSLNRGSFQSWIHSPSPDILPYDIQLCCGLKGNGTFLDMNANESLLPTVMSFTPNLARDSMQRKKRKMKEEFRE